MGVLEDQARFLTAKYGTAAGPVGITHAPPVTTDIAVLMVVLGILIFAAVLFSLVRNYQLEQAAYRND
jgi:hypothetical protein